ncbi:helix-turn-helix domain-containing protein [Pseudomonas fluorescens]|nr:helix-turn-helix transcriptional regulator [Pseudomonas fluorescens]
MVRAQQVHAQVQALKAQGLRQAEVARELGLPKSTVQRNWHVGV